MPPRSLYLLEGFGSLVGKAFAAPPKRGFSSRGYSSLVAKTHNFCFLARAPEGGSHGPHGLSARAACQTHAAWRNSDNCSRTAREAWSSVAALRTNENRIVPHHTCVRQEDNVMPSGHCVRPCHHGRREAASWVNQSRGAASRAAKVKSTKPAGKAAQGEESALDLVPGVPKQIFSCPRPNR
jgi:hypothetical protein